MFDESQLPPNRLPNGQPEDQEMDGSIPFLSPFPHTAYPAVLSGESSLSSSSGAVSTLNNTVSAADSDKIVPTSIEHKEEEGDILYEVTVDVSESNPTSSEEVGQRIALERSSRTIASPSLEAGRTNTANAVPLSSPEEVAKSLVSSAEGVGEEAAPSPSALPVHLEYLDLTSRNDKREVEGASNSAEGSRSFEMQEERDLLFTSAPSRFSSSLEFLIGNSSLRKGNGGGFPGSATSFVSKENTGADTLMAKISAPPMRPTISESDCSKVGDRLLAIAERLLSVDHHVSSICLDKTQRGLKEGEERGRHGSAEPCEGLQEALTAESRLRTETARKLLLLSKVLSGRHPISEYCALYDEAG